MVGSGCLVVFAMGLLGFWWVLFYFFYFGFLVPVGLVSKGQWWRGGHGGGVVGSGLFGCFCYGFAGFLVGFVLFFFFLILGFWFRWVWSAEGSGGVVVIVCLVVEQVRERLGVHEQCFNTHRSSESSRTV